MQTYFLKTLNTQAGKLEKTSKMRFPNFPAYGFNAVENLNQSKLMEDCAFLLFFK